MTLWSFDQNILSSITDCHTHAHRLTPAYHKARPSQAVDEDVYYYCHVWNLKVDNEKKVLRHLKAALYNVHGVAHFVPCIITVTSAS